MFSYERVRLVDGLVICVKWIWCGRYCWCLAGRWGIVDFLGVVSVQVGDRVWVVLCCVVRLLCICILLISSFCSDYGVG